MKKSLPAVVVVLGIIGVVFAVAQWTVIPPLAFFCTIYKLPAHH